MKGSLVLDVSIALTWCFEDEMTPASMDLLTAISSLDLVVPALWHSELANVLVAGERRQRINEPAIDAFLGLLRDLLIETDQPRPGFEIGSVMAVARRHGLTAYDAAYLELALRRGIPLATYDAALRRAATEAGVALLPV